MKILKFALLAIITFLAISVATAQEKPKSPAEKVSGMINGATIQINYGSPSVRGREIWGKLVPFGEVWRAGANEATTFETNKDLLIEGLRLPAGKYSFFVIPSQTECVIIFNKEPKQWGAYKYDERKDQLRVKVKQQIADSSTEKLTYIINATDVELVWEKWIIGFSVK
ncbi:DUF2911 domain-containing protein [Flavobacterium taihuense]|uniref:DUF2911 domain-containing protein n=1 Tax=Flavobacterium taihuense TaxID=2857508 RepID=A0ABS6XYW1_9FLAO|nr:DUF2911 domain-containing protein [Flavobacterium taihuense]MBW4361779.1 DUF2911 domain-containing protein [Flavobacterium taihuense]